MLFLVAMRVFIIARLAVPDEEAILFGSFDKTAGESIFPLRSSSWFYLSCFLSVLIRVSRRMYSRCMFGERETIFDFRRTCVALARHLNIELRRGTFL